MPTFRVDVLVKTGARRRKIVASADRKSLTIWTTARPIEGKANREVVDMIADYFQVPKTSVSLERGGSSKKKVFKIMA